MLRTFLYFSLSMILVSCSSPKSKTVVSEPLLQKSDSMVGSNETNFTNPALIYGTSIGELAQVLYKQGRWPELIKFISSTTIHEFGEENIISSFQRSDFGYEIKLKSMSIIGKGHYLMNYQTLKFGTLGVLRMNVIIENDTAKIVIKQIYPNIEFDESYGGTKIPYFGC